MMSNLSNDAEKALNMTKSLLAVSALALLIVMPLQAGAQSMPSATQIERTLQAPPPGKVPPRQRATVNELKRRPDLRKVAPSIEIQAINFAFGAADIAPSQYPKVERIATAMRRILRRSPREVFLIEGHTDAVGTAAANLQLSEARARSLKRVLVRQFGIPRQALETVGYGESFLLVPTQNENWRN